MQDLNTTIDTIWFAFQNIGVMDILDIAVVAFLIYQFINVIRSTSTARVAKSIVFLLLLTLFTDFAQMQVLNFLLNRILELGIIALVVVFQPEIRRFLERFGGQNVMVSSH